MNLAGKTDGELSAIIRNHERVSRAHEPGCQAALAERARRAAPGVDLVTSLEAIHKAARERRFLCYKDLSEASKANWSKVRYKINGHLGDIVRMATAKKLPMLSAIVVTKPNIETGRMEGETLEGFVNAARGLGYIVEDAEAFLKEQQEAVFSAAQEHETFRFVAP